MSCLFDSLSTYTSLDSTELRHQIVQYLSTNPVLMDDVTFSDVAGWEGAPHEEYIRSMRQETTWGGGIEIRAFANLFRMNVNVHIPQNQRTIEFIGKDHESTNTEKTLPTVNILWTGNHFVPVRLVQRPPAEQVAT